MTIGPITNSPLTFYMPALTPISRVPKVQGNASEQLIKAARDLKPDNSPSTIYGRSLKTETHPMPGTTISVTV